jgi:hypothetical protein
MADGRNGRDGEGRSRAGRRGVRRVGYRLVGQRGRSEGLGVEGPVPAVADGAGT